MTGHTRIKLKIKHLHYHSICTFSNVCKISVTRTNFKSLSSDHFSIWVRARHFGQIQGWSKLIGEQAKTSQNQTKPEIIILNASILIHSLDGSSQCATIYVCVCVRVCVRHTHTTSLTGLKSRYVIRVLTECLSCKYQYVYINCSCF